MTERGLVDGKEKLDFVRELIVLALEIGVLVAELLEKCFVMTTARDDQRVLQSLNVLLKLLDARQSLVRLALGLDDVVPHVLEILFEGVYPTAQVLVVGVETLDLTLGILQLVTQELVAVV